MVVGVRILALMACKRPPICRTDHFSAPRGVTPMTPPGAKNVIHLTTSVKRHDDGLEHELVEDVAETWPVKLPA